MHIQETRASIHCKIHSSQQRVKTLWVSGESRGVEGQIGRNQQRRLGKALLAAGREYDRVQKGYRTSKKMQMERQYRIVRPQATPEEIQTMLASDGGIFQQEMLENRIGSEREQLEEVKRRHDELRKVEESIQELVQMFNEMELMLNVGYYQELGLTLF